MASSKVEAYGGGAKDALNEASLSFWPPQTNFIFNNVYFQYEIFVWKIILL